MMRKKLSEMHYSEIGYSRNPEPPNDSIDQDEVERYCYFDQGDEFFFWPANDENAEKPLVGVVVERRFPSPQDLRYLWSTDEVIGETEYHVKLENGDTLWIGADQIDLGWEPEENE